MVYGPIAAFLVEASQAKIRYTSMSLPYHFGNGWFRIRAGDRHVDRSSDGEHLCRALTCPRSGCRDDVRRWRIPAQKRPRSEQIWNEVD